MSKYLSLRSPFLYIGFVLAVSLGASSYAWFDHLTSRGETVAGNVEYAGMRLDAMTEGEVQSVAEARSAAVLASLLRIDTPEGPLMFELAEVGFTYDTELTVDRIMAARHVGGPVDQFTEWVRTLFTTKEIVEPVGFDHERARNTLTSVGALRYEEPVEPGIEMNENWRLQVVPGQPGAIADLDGIIDQLAALDPLSDELTAEASSIELPPQVSDDRAQVVTDTLNDLTTSGIRLTIGGEIRQMSPAALRRNLEVTITDGDMIPSFDMDGLQKEIEEVFPGPVGDDVDPTFEVSGEAVSLVEAGIPPRTCCSDDTAEKIGRVVLEGAEGPFALTTRPQDDPEVVAWYDGSLVVEQVSSFTTPHSCCESRVVNIQRMADIVRGYYLTPGEILSLNDYVGPRTREKGFVPAGAIRAGHLTPEVGGGVSQFATTIFNAAYFAGMDFIEYQAHSLYFSRYPYGREATISSPAPDLVFQNTTEYPILIWTSYTSTSITVSMYSTEHIEVEQVATRSSRRNQCTYVETDRERIYPDGAVVIDTFWALYRPADGVDCNGNPIPQ